jgi:hypothetical protein
MPVFERHVQNIKSMISSKNKDLTNVLQNMLSFNPYFRMTAFECLIECKIFDGVRDTNKESGLLTMRNASKS